MNVLLILGFLGNPARAALRAPVLDILENLFLPPNPNVNNLPEQGELIQRLREEVVGILRFLIDHPNHPELASILGYMQSMIVRDRRLGFAMENPILGRFLRILRRMLEDGANLPVQLQHGIIQGLRRLFYTDIAGQHVYNDAEIRRLQYTASLFELFLNHPLIVGQGNRDIQHQFLNRVIVMLMQPGNYTNEHFELLLLMGQLLVEANGFDEALQGRLRDLLNGLHQDADGRAFIENFENILMEIIADDEGDEHAAPEPTDSGESARTREYIRQIQRRRLNHIAQSSSGQTGERQLYALEDTAQSKRQRTEGGKRKKPAKPSAKKK